MCQIYSVLLHFTLCWCKIFAHLRAFPDFPSFSGEDVSLQMKQKHHKVNCCLLIENTVTDFLYSQSSYILQRLPKQAQSQIT